MSHANNFKDITGQRFGRLTVISFADCTNYDVTKQARWLCRCDCGTEKIIRAGSLQRGATRSCGCLIQDTIRARSIGNKYGHKHGMANTPEYFCWAAMKHRCSSPKEASYKNYGGRGIKVCKRWNGKGGFANFIADMGSRPGPEYSLDRIDNDGNYCPENCRWTTKEEQTKNKFRVANISDKIIEKEFFKRFSNKYLIKQINNYIIENNP